MTRNAQLGLGILVVVIALFLFAHFGSFLIAPILQNTSAIKEVPQQAGFPSIGSDAPYFELTDLSGNRVRLSDFADTPILVTFWSTRERDAADQIKIFDDWALSHPNALFKILSINSMEERSVVKSFIVRGSYGALALLDREGEVGKAYGIQTLPTSFFIDGRGILRGAYVGIMSQKMIEDKSETIVRQ